MKKFIQLSGELFERVQLEEVFADSKTFVDSIPKLPPEEILSKYNSQKNNVSFNLKDFILENFTIPETNCLENKLDKNRSMNQHIDIMWDLLTQKADNNISENSTLLPLPYPYIIPGGRFLEVYYWDSYFTAEGLAKAGKLDLIENIASNFAYLVDTYGHIPNGNRAYYLSRSQPPFFCSIIDLIYRMRGINHIEKYLASLEKEYLFWTETEHAVNYKGNLMNRFWDNSETPREESYKEDFNLCEEVNPADKGTFYRNLRAGAESGWDYTARWFKDGKNISTIITTEILPVDLNCLIYDMEHKLAIWFEESGNQSKALNYAGKAEKRKEAINKLFWNKSKKFYFDFNFIEEKQTDVWSIAGAYPLYFKIADRVYAEEIVKNITDKFLKPGGVLSTLSETTQQWDYPNGWAPHQWIVFKGLKNYGFDNLADDIAKRFINAAEGVFLRNGKMMEKYNVCDLSLLSGGGEYPAQDGFGWTNGIVSAMS